MEPSSRSVERFLSLGEVLILTGASRSTIWRWQQEGAFPQSRRIGKRKVGIPEREYQEWASTRLAAS